LKINLALVTGMFECPDCGAETRWSYTDLYEKGNPVCDKCDCAMQLTGYVGEANYEAILSNEGSRPAA
jgi:hypothetical protein